MLNGVLDTHHDRDAASQVLGQVYDVAGNVISDTSPFAVDNCWAVRCTSSNIVLEWKLQASLATAQTQTYTVTWHNANPTAMNDRNYVYQFWDDFAGNSLASSYTLPTCTTTAANYSVQVMGSPDYVGAVHQMLDGIMLALGVSADFLCGDVTAAGVIVRCEVDMGSAIVGGMTMRGAFAVGDMILRCSFAVNGVTAGSEVVVGGDAIVAGGMIVAVDYDVAQELAKLIGADCKTKNGSALSCLPLRLHRRDSVRVCQLVVGLVRADGFREGWSKIWPSASSRRCARRVRT